MKQFFTVLVLLICATSCVASDDDSHIIITKDESGNIHIKEVPPEPSGEEGNPDIIEEQHRERRQAIIDNDPACEKRWPNGYIPYRYDTTVKPYITSFRPNIEQAVQNWQTSTCLVLEDITDDSSKWNQPHLVVQGEEGRSCRAIIGRDCNSNGQYVNLDKNCGTIGLIMHEFAHAFGLYHQHVRTDRDNYIVVEEHNINDTRLHEFEIKQSDMYNTPYDLTSLLHYGKMTWSKNNKPTIRTIDPMLQYIIGNPPEPSHYDLMIVNAMYNCAGNCNNPPQCKNGGFVDKHCQCKCPHNTEGDLCETVTGEYYKKKYDNCGQQIIESDGIIQSINWPNAKPLSPQEILCQFYLKAPPGKMAQLTFDHFDLWDDPKCRADSMDIMLDLYTVDQHVCGTSLQGKTINATHGSIMLLWSGRTPGWPKGFQASVKFIDEPTPSITVAPPPPPTAAPTAAPTPPPTVAPTPPVEVKTTTPKPPCLKFITLSTHRRYIFSAGYPKGKGPQQCEWVIKNAQNNRGIKCLKITINRLRIPSTRKSCKKDYFKVDRTGAQKYSNQKRCRHTVLRGGKTMSVLLVINTKGTYKGFKAEISKRKC